MHTEMDESEQVRSGKQENGIVYTERSHLFSSCLALYENRCDPTRVHCNSVIRTINSECE